MRRATILLYHRVVARSPDPYQLATTPQDFETQLYALRRRYNLSFLREIGLPSKRPRLIITFDDGYADNWAIAAPIASRLHVPITVFVSTGFLDDPRGFWWDRLNAICARATDEFHNDTSIHLNFPTTQLTFRLRGPNGPDALRTALHIRLRKLRRPVIDQVLDELAGQLGVDSAGDPRAPVLSSKELAELSAFDNVEIGAHTVDHEMLSNLPYAQQRDQILRSITTLNEIVGYQVHHFAYPFGGSDALNGDSMRIVRQLQIRTAVTTAPGRVLRLTPRHRLPRYTVTPDEAPEALLRKIGSYDA